MEIIPPEIITESLESETGRLTRLLREAQKKYTEKRILVELLKNNGKYNGYSNKCILLSIRDLLTLYGIVYDLSINTNFWHDEMFDIDNPKDLAHLKELLTQVAKTAHSNIICYFYYVSFGGDSAFVSPEYKIQITSQTKFKATQILRIANYPGYHFEAIIPSVYDQFIDEPIDAAHKRLDELQKQLYLSEDRLLVLDETVNDLHMSLDDISTQYLLLREAEDKLRLQQHQEAKQITEIKEKYPEWIEEIGNFRLSAKGVIVLFENKKDKLEEDRLSKEYLKSLGIDINEQKTLFMLGNESRK